MPLPFDLELFRRVKAISQHGTLEARDALIKYNGDPYAALGYLSVKGHAVVRPPHIWESIISAKAEEYRTQFPELAGPLRESPPGIEWIGFQMAPHEERGDWIRLVLALHEASQPGGDLDGRVFHGTSAEDAALMMEHGMDASAVLTREKSGDKTSQVWKTGTYWATSWIAAVYAEDKCLSENFLRHPHTPMGFVAARLSDVAECGDLILDEQSADCPIDSRLLRLGHRPDEIARDLERSSQDWRASFDILGSFVCLGSVDADKLYAIDSMDALTSLTDKVRQDAENVSNPSFG